MRETTALMTMHFATIGQFISSAWIHSHSVTSCFQFYYKLFLLNLIFIVMDKLPFLFTFLKRLSLVVCGKCFYSKYFGLLALFQVLTLHVFFVPQDWNHVSCRPNDRCHHHQQLLRRFILYWNNTSSSSFSSVPCLITHPARNFLSTFYSWLSALFSWLTSILGKRQRVWWQIISVVSPPPICLCCMDGGSPVRKIYHICVLCIMHVPFIISDH